MTTITPLADPQVALPPGADPEHTDNWETDNGVTSRLVWSLPDPLLKSTCEHDVRVVASQRLDGSIIVGVPSEVPLVYLDGQDYSLEQARMLARAMLAAVALADEWTGETAAIEVIR